MTARTRVVSAARVVVMGARVVALTTRVVRTGGHILSALVVTNVQVIVSPEFLGVVLRLYLAEGIVSR